MDDGLRFGTPEDLDGIWEVFRLGFGSKTPTGGEGRLTPGGDGTIEIGVGGLSSWWSGYTSARTLANTGHLQTADPTALATLDGLGASAAPTLVDFY